jgi:hypothetical protein
MMARAFMKENPVEGVDPLIGGDAGLAIFYRFGDTFAFVEDLRVPSNKGGAFHKAMNGTSFYRSGGSVTIMCAKGMLVVPDDRTTKEYGVPWFKPFPVGLAQYSQGHDLALAAQAEFEQEAIVYSLSKGKVQYIPLGIPPHKHCASIDANFAGYERIGELIFHSFFVNKAERAYECRLIWDITSLDMTKFSVHYQEDLWFLGGQPNIPVWVLNTLTGQPEGLFSGQQGFLPHPNTWKLHPSVANLCGKPMPEKIAA